MQLPNLWCYKQKKIRGGNNVQLMLFRVETNIQHPRSNFKKVKKNKKLPTFCVFCKVILLSVDKKSTENHAFLLPLDELSTFP